MKRLLPFIPIILLFLINSCTVGNTPEINPTAAAAMSQVATLWTQTPTQTINPDIHNLINSLNTDLPTANTLGWIMDAQYYVTDVTFPIASNGSYRNFRLDIDCICMNKANCCVPERTFVIIIESMKRIYSRIPPHIFGGGGDVIVVCTDHKTKESIGAVSAPLQEVFDYIQGSTLGHELGIQAHRTELP